MAQHETLGEYEFRVEPIGKQPIEWLCTDNETNPRLHPAYPSEGKYFKDAFHRRIIDREEAAVDPRRIGTKVAAWHQIELEPGESHVFRCRLRSKELPSIDPWFGDSFDQIMEQRRQEADQFYREVIPEHLVGEVRNVSRQAYAGLTWSKQCSPDHDSKDAMPIGSTCSTATSSRCPTSGSIPGTQPGIWLFT
jgi:DNA-binding Lrp family transcriptional regulator